MKIKDLLKNCMITNIVIYDMKTNEAFFRGCTDNVGEWLKERKKMEIEKSLTMMLT